MKLYNILPLIAAAVIIIFNKQLLDNAEKKYKSNNRPFDRRIAFILLMSAVGILILKGLWSH